MKAYGGVGVQINIFLSGQLHASAALPPEIEPQIPIG
jgi:hypothetical protein